MRLSIVIALLAVPASVSAQALPCTPERSSLLRFDPYKPSDLAIVRNLGGTVLTQAPLQELLKLDPYVPSEGALLRQAGNGIPVWAYAAFPSYSPAVYSPGANPPAPASVPCEPVAEPATAGITTFNQVIAQLAPQPSGSPRRAVATAASGNRGISIEYDGRVWISAGPAIPFVETDFLRVGERAGAAIYQRPGSKDPVIYIPTTAGMVAPFRAVQ